MRTVLILITLFSACLDQVSFATADYLVGPTEHHSSVQDSGHDHSEHESDSEDSCHTNCHVGHSHCALVVESLTSIYPLVIQNDKSYPDLRLSSIQEFHSKIIRPPIS